MSALDRSLSPWRLVVLGALVAAYAAACHSSGATPSDAGADAADDAPIPDMPSYAADVKPILLANCVRCHGAGGTLNVDPASTLNYPPPNGYFDHYEDLTDCTPGDGGVVPDTCKNGAASLAPAMKFYVNDDDFPMPPPPAPRLSTRERAIISRWADEMPPLP